MQTFVLIISGFQALKLYMSAGVRIVTVTGVGHIGDGHGIQIITGAGVPITMEDGGIITATVGSGLQDTGGGIPGLHGVIQAGM